MMILMVRMLVVHIACSFPENVDAIIARSKKRVKRRMLEIRFFCCMKSGFGRYQKYRFQHGEYSCFFIVGFRICNLSWWYWFRV